MSENHTAAITKVRKVLLERIKTVDAPISVLHAPELKSLFEQLKITDKKDKATFGKALNDLRSELEEAVSKISSSKTEVTPIDITAPWDVNTKVDQKPRTLASELGSVHPLMAEITRCVDIFYRMGFTATGSRELDDDYHMFGSLNFPEGHPARDDYDSFVTDEGLIAPAHTSTMQNRILKKYKTSLEAGEPIAVVIPDRVFRNEDVDARHEHTFYQLEGIYVNKDVTVGNLIATIQAWLSSYFGKDIKTKIQPFYFPFTEPSFEFAASCIFCEGKGCSVCSQSGWIELGGCGMIHPNVLKMAGIDAEKYTGFAWGFGIDRLVMLKHNIEDVRHFESGKLEFLRQFS